MMPEGPLCEYWAPDGEDAPFCGHSSCYTIIDPNDDPGPPPHECAYEIFLDDPITQAYGVGSEMLPLISCPTCDAYQA